MSNLHLNEHKYQVSPEFQAYWETVCNEPHKALMEKMQAWGAWQECQRQMAKPMKIDGKLSIGKVHTRDGHHMEICIEDSKSGTRFVELEIGMTEFAEAITNLSNRPCVVELRGLHHVGKTIEIKHEKIDVTQFKSRYGMSGDEPEFKEVLKPFEIDGWIATDPRDLRNHHRMTYHKDGTVTANLSFRRYV
jgi:hypothetical protein